MNGKSASISVGEKTFQMQTAAALVQSIVVSECKYYNFMTNNDDDEDDDDNNNNNNNNKYTSSTMYKMYDRTVRNKTSRYIP